MADTAVELNEALLTQLNKESLVLLSTVDAETGAPTSSAISWVYAEDHITIKFALDQRSRLIANMHKQPQVTLTVFASGTVHAVSGRCLQAAEALTEVPFKLACFTLRVEAVRDAMFYGARISAEPEYEKTYDKRAAEKLDGQVFAAMKKA